MGEINHRIFTNNRFVFVGRQSLADELLHQNLTGLAIHRQRIADLQERVASGDCVIWEITKNMAGKPAMMVKRQDETRIKFSRLSFPA